MNSQFKKLVVGDGLVTVRELADAIGLDRSVVHKDLKRLGVPTEKRRDSDARGSYVSVVTRSDAEHYMLNRRAESIVGSGEITHIEPEVTTPLESSSVAVCELDARSAAAAEVCGHHLGTVWGSKHATPDEIGRLRDAWCSLGPIEEDSVLIPSDTDAYSAAEKVHAMISGEEIDRDESRDFWSSYAPAFDDEALGDPDFLAGFIGGALDGAAMVD